MMAASDGVASSRAAASLSYEVATLKFSIAPDSVWCATQRDGRGWHTALGPWVWLVWLVWLAGPAFLGNHDFPFPHWVLPTALSVPVFVAVYVAAYFAPRRYMGWFALAIIGICMAVTPFNPFAQTYAIYACAVAAAWSTARKSGLLVLLILAVYTAQWMALRFPWISIVNIWILCPIIAGMIMVQQSQARHRAELRLSHDEIRRLAASAERERIGRDLHDLLGHTLSMVALKSELAGRLIERDPVAAKREMAEVERVAREALAQVRSAVSGIRAAALASELASARLLLETAGVHVDYFNDGHELPPDVETCLAMVLREAVTNIHRHARANNVEVSVIAGVERAVMRVRDDGRGGVGAYGNGLTGMRERITARGGEIWIDSPQGKGTVLEVRLPLPRVPVAAERQKIVPITAATSAQHAGGRA